MAKNPPSTIGDLGLTPGQGTKIPRAVGQLSQGATAREPSCHGKRSHMLQLTPDAAK